MEFDPQEATEASLIVLIQRAQTPFSPDTFAAIQEFGYSQADAAIDSAREQGLGAGLIARIQAARDHLGVAKTDQDLKNAVADVLSDWGQVVAGLSASARNTGDVYNVLHGILVAGGVGVALPTIDGRSDTDDLKAAIESGKEGIKDTVVAAANLAAPIGDAAKSILQQLLDILSSVGIAAGAVIGVAIIGGVVYLYYTRKQS